MPKREIVTTSQKRFIIDMVKSGKWNVEEAAMALDMNANTVRKIVYGGKRKKDISNKKGD